MRRDPLEGHRCVRVSKTGEHASSHIHCSLCVCVCVCVSACVCVYVCLCARTLALTPGEKLGNSGDYQGTSGSVQTHHAACVRPEKQSNEKSSLDADSGR